MALLHRAEISPTKIEMLRAWIPRQPWSAVLDLSTIEIVDAFRFDDPEGVVGIETFLVRAADGTVMQVPVTYRPGPIEGDPGTAYDTALVTTMTHTVLGDRWVYDGTEDPVYLAALARTILTGGEQAELEFDTEVPAERRVVTARVRGSGVTRESGTAPDAIPVADFVTTEVLRIVGGPAPAVLESGTSGEQTYTLTGTWPGQDEPALLATARTH